MAKKVPLGSLGILVVEEVKAKSALEYKATAFEIFSQVIQKTPVKTGRARANWNISTETPDYTTSTSTVSDLNLELEVGDFPNVYVSNGLDYVVDLENGRSKTQAPAGIITPALAAAMANRRR
jgi:short subunit dehydrogenase-like uncharacterized protein